MSEQEQGIARVVEAATSLHIEFGRDLPDSAREYLRGETRISPEVIVIGAAAWGMLGMHMSPEEVTAVLTKAMNDITAPPTGE